MLTRTARNLFALTLTLALLGAPLTGCGDADDNNTSGTTACAGDNDCKGDRVCEAGQCVAPQSQNNTTNNTTTNNTTSNNTTTQQATCAQVCQHLSGLCPDFPNDAQCLSGCEANISAAQRRCAVAAQTCGDADACVSTPQNNTTNNTTNNDTNKPNGAECFAGEECMSGFCNTPVGALEGTCAAHDFGKTCRIGGDCMFGLCRSTGGAELGYCTRECDSGSDCPTFWSCEKADNTSTKYCKQ